MSAELPPIDVVYRTWPYLMPFLRGLAMVPWPRGAYATSWYRGQAQNLRVGGHPESQHRLGLAIDVAWSGYRFNADLNDAIRATGLVPVWEPTHLHVQYFTAGTAGGLGLFRDV